MYGMSIRYQYWQNIGRGCMDYKSNLNKFGYPVEMLSCLLLADGGCALSTWWWSSCVVCQEWYGQLPQGPLSCGAGSGGRGPHTLSQTGPGHLVMEEEERGEYKESRATLTYSAHALPKVHHSCWRYDAAYTSHSSNSWQSSLVE